MDMYKMTDFLLGESEGMDAPTTRRLWLDQDGAPYLTEASGVEPEASAGPVPVEIGPWWVDATDAGSSDAPDEAARLLGELYGH